MSTPATWDLIRAEVENVLDAAGPDEIPALLGELEALRARLWRRLEGPGVVPTPLLTASPAGADRLLSANEAAEILGVTARWLRQHASEIPGNQRLSPRALRFSERKLRRWMAQRSA